MYTVVLMMALSGNADVPGCHFHCHKKAEEAPACTEPAPCADAPAAPAPTPPPATPIPEKPKEVPPKMEKEKAQLPGVYSTFVVVLPAEATLTIQGKKTVTQGANRTFITPELPSGVVRNYTFTAEIIVDGKPVTQTRKVEFRTGETVNVQLDFPQPSVAAR
jgi:uncharacterized protein (TIGR03000 family)